MVRTNSIPPFVDVLVSGSEGFIGRHLCRRLVSEGYGVHGIDLRLGHDLCDAALLQELPEFSVAIHLAARTFIPDSLREPEAFLRNNVSSTLNILEASRSRGARMILASTYLYGIPAALPINEEHPVSLPHPYALSKYAAESLCAAYARAGQVDVMIFRPFNVYGPGQDKRFLIPSFLAQWGSGRVLLDDPTPRRDYLYVGDMVEAYVAAIRAPLHGLELVNLGSGESHSVKEVATLLSSLLPGEAEVEYSGITRENEVPETRADIGKARQLLGWTPRIGLEEGLRLTIQHQSDL
jgi:UDP-glucose 4-epimerase